MRKHSSLRSSLVAGFLATMVLAPALWAQQAAPGRARNSAVLDWSHHHLIFSNPNGASLPTRLSPEPRYWQAWRQLNQAPGAAGAALARGTGGRTPKPPKRLKRDWAVSLGPGATVGAGQYPAKFAFNLSTASCASAPAPDYVAFNTSVAGSATQATIVAFDNLYSGCSGTVPSTYWAYNTGGTVRTSSVLSLDGSQLAFAQTSAGQAQLVLLKWKASTTATSTSPDAITLVTPSQYSTCTAPCMTTVTFSGVTNDTNSSPFYDYANDILYVGDDVGALHKFTPVFQAGTPAEVTTGWPVSLAPGLKLSSPVFDQTTGRVFVGSSFSVSGSQLFAVDAASGAVTGTSSSLGQGAGIVTGPIVDSSAGEIFVFVGNDGGAGCSGPCSAVYQFSTSFTLGTGIKATVGFGGSLPAFTGTFDNAYFTSASSTGNLLVCGGGSSGAEPTIFKIPINSGVMSAASVAGPPFALSNVACSPVTDVFNPASGGIDRIFTSVPTGGDGAACAGGGCIMSLGVTAWQPSTAYVTGQRILDANNFMQTVVTGGTSKSGTPPIWAETCGFETTDGTVTWTSSGFLTPITAQAWTGNTFFSVGFRITDSNGNLECALLTGVHSGLTPPVWNTTVGGITNDSSLQWRNGGSLGSSALPAAGGTSGIIVDNVVGTGTLAGASQIYFSTLGTGGCGAGNGCAVQASQSGLN